MVDGLEQTNEMILLISLGLDSSLITKVSLHTFPHPDPLFSPPQTFSQLKAMEKGKTFQEDTCLSCMVFSPHSTPFPGFGELCSILIFQILNLNLLAQAVGVAVGQR